MPDESSGIFFFYLINEYIKMKNTLLLVCREGIGNGDLGLQTILAINFFNTLLKENQTPKTIFFYAEGVKLNLHGSVIEDQLAELERRGTSILTCTTCLNFYESLSELATGKKAGMVDMIRLIGESAKVVSL